MSCQHQIGGGVNVTGVKAGGVGNVAGSYKATQGVGFLLSRTKVQQMCGGKRCEAMHAYLSPPVCPVCLSVCSRPGPTETRIE